MRRRDLRFSEAAYFLDEDDIMARGPPRCWNGSASSTSTQYTELSRLIEASVTDRGAIPLISSTMD